MAIEELWSQICDFDGVGQNSYHQNKKQNFCWKTEWNSTLNFGFPPIRYSKDNGGHNIWIYHLELLNYSELESQICRLRGKFKKRVNLLMGLE